MPVSPNAPSNSFLNIRNIMTGYTTPPNTDRGGGTILHPAPTPTGGGTVLTPVSDAGIFMVPVLVPPTYIYATNSLTIDEIVSGISSRPMTDPGVGIPAPPNTIRTDIDAILRNAAMSIQETEAMIAALQLFLRSNAVALGIVPGQDAYDKLALLLAKLQAQDTRAIYFIAAYLQLHPDATGRELLTALLANPDTRAWAAALVLNCNGVDGAATYLEQLADLLEDGLDPYVLVGPPLKSFDPTNVSPSSSSSQRQSRAALPGEGYNLLSTDLALSGWGGTPTLGMGPLLPTLARFQASLTAGSSPSANPTITIPMSVDARSFRGWQSTPLVLCTASTIDTGVTVAAVDAVVTGDNLVLTYMGTPAATKTYVFTCQLVG